MRHAIQITKVANICDFANINFGICARVALCIGRLGNFVLIHIDFES